MLRSYSKSGVPAAVAAAGYEELAHHLAGPSYYRPSLEPFLDFVLTRSIPHAVKRRVEMGLNDRIGRAREYGRRFYFLPSARNLSFPTIDCSATHLNQLSPRQSSKSKLHCSSSDRTLTPSRTDCPGRKQRST